MNKDNAILEIQKRMLEKVSNERPSSKRVKEIL
jgi:hypothetical protein